MKEDEREKDDADHHRERRGIVWIGCHDEALVLIVPQRTDWYCSNLVQMCVSDPSVIHRELVDTDDVRQLEFCGKNSILKSLISWKIEKDIPWV